jgi:hypothetical protein
MNLQGRWIAYALTLAANIALTVALTDPNGNVPDWWWAVYGGSGVLMGFLAYSTVKAGAGEDGSVARLFGVLAASIWPVALPYIIALLHQDLKEFDSGKHRSAQANRQDPGTGQGTGSTIDTRTRASQAACGAASLSYFENLDKFAGSWALTFSELVPLAAKQLFPPGHPMAMNPYYVQNGLQVPLPTDRPWLGDPAQVLFDDEIRRLTSHGQPFQTVYDQTLLWWKAYKGGQHAAGARALSSTFNTAAAIHEAFTLGMPAIEEEDMPILAHRAAHLELVPRQGLKLKALNQPTYLEVDMDAVCNKHCGHQAPDWNCACGFYAVPSDIPSWHQSLSVDLLVELSGIVIEYTQGYRAQHQHICEVILPRCDICGRESTQGLVAASDLDGYNTERQIGIAFYVCDRHTRGDMFTITAEDMAEQLGIPVSGRSIT